VSNSLEVVHYCYTPHPPLLVGDNRSCQFAPYNTLYGGLHGDLLAAGLGAAATSEDGQRQLQCGPNRWKHPVEVSKLELPQIHSEGVAINEDWTETAVLLPALEFRILFIPVEDEDGGMGTGDGNGAGAPVPVEVGMEGVVDTETEDTCAGADIPIGSPTAPSYEGGGLSSPPATPPRGDETAPTPQEESSYCHQLSEMMQQCPFRLPQEYERRALGCAERVRSVHQAIKEELPPELQDALEEELNRGFREWLVSSGNLRQVLDLVHLAEMR